MKTSDQRERTVLVTGASSGIAAAVSRQASWAGWRVLLGFGAGRARPNADDIDATGHRAIPVHLPWHDVARIERSIGALPETDTLPHALDLCASRPLAVGAFTKASKQSFRQQFDVNVIGNHALISKLRKTCFRPRRDGHIDVLLTTALGPRPGKLVEIGS